MYTLQPIREQQADLGHRVLQRAGGEPRGRALATAAAAPPPPPPPLVLVHAPTGTCRRLLRASMSQTSRPCCHTLPTAPTHPPHPPYPPHPHHPPTHPQQELGVPTQDPGCVCAKAASAGLNFLIKRVALDAAGISCSRYCASHACVAKASCQAAAPSTCGVLPAAPVL